MSISAIAGLVVAVVFFILWLREQAKYGKLLEAHLQTKEQHEARALSAPQQDSWAVRQLRLIELAWLGYREAYVCMDGEIAPYIHAQQKAVVGNALERWHAYRKLNEYLRDIALGDWPDSDDDSIDDWLESCEEALGREITDELLIPILRIDEVDREDLFTKVSRHHNNLARLAKGDWAALSMEPAELVAYLRYIGVSEERIEVALQKYGDRMKAMSYIDAVLSRPFPKKEREEASADDPVLSEIRALKMSIESLPEAERTSAHARVCSLEARIIDMRQQHEAERVRVKLDEVETSVEAEEEMADLLQPPYKTKL